MFIHKSECECTRGCGIVKVEHRQPGSYWTEYWRGLERISTGKAPACEVAG